MHVEPIADVLAAIAHDAGGIFACREERGGVGRSFQDGKL